ncbi:unnamed protein product [marine sediment metagenome]|uniref:Uncharacterized protein n=1 Tax=marine sediment metagenome TaxID=412755 RepID=X0VE58_9ZZZZ
MIVSCQETEEPQPANDSYCVYRKEVSTNAQVPSYWVLHTCLDLDGYINKDYKYIESIGCDCPNRL